MGALLLLTVALLLTGSCEGRPSERSPSQLKAAATLAVQHHKLAVAHDVPHTDAPAASPPKVASARHRRYFPLGLPGSGLGGGVGGGGYHRLFGLYPSLFGGTYYSMFGGVSRGGPFPYPPVYYRR